MTECLRKSSLKDSKKFEKNDPKCVKLNFRSFKVVVTKGTVIKCDRDISTVPGKISEH